MWDEMGLVRVYTKPQGQQPDFGDPVVLSAVRCIMIVIFRVMLTCALRAHVLHSTNGKKLLQKINIQHFEQ
jgi:ribosome-interacting GTPase 1